MKRVANLYRVSTKKQVDLVKDDIPMQRIACREFAERQGWTVVIEKEEKGISGFKVSASKRDAIQELKDSALKGEFDVLLVFCSTVSVVSKTKRRLFLNGLRSMGLKYGASTKVNKRSKPIRINS